MKVKLIHDPILNNYGESLLRARGIKDIEKFLNPDESCLQDWRDLDNIEEGIKLIIKLRPNAEVGMIVDCDVDGFTSASIMGQYLKTLYPHISISYYLHDGKAHGLEEHWKDIKDENYDLLIIPDAGSNDSEYAKEINCPILVLDHHLVEDSTPARNMTIINNQLSPKYHNKNLSGAGVVYQFCRGLDETIGRDIVSQHIDLAALGICGDMMSGLEIENQYFWKKGFSQVNNYFFLTIARKQGYSLTGKISPTDEEIIEALNPISVAFYVVPLINAMVRVGTQDEKERMLMAFLDGHELVESHKRGAKGTMEEVAVESVRECTNARSRQNKTLDSAVEQLEQKIYKYDLLENKILFIRLEEEKFPSELNGLLAMKLSQKYKHPAIVARLNDEGYDRGSLRGLSNSELVSFKAYLDSTGLCEYVMGHDNAAGVSIKDENLSELHRVANRDLAQFDFGEDYYEADFARQALSDDLADIIYDLARYKNVWGQQNSEPIIYVKDLHFKYSDVQIMGKNKDTVKIVKNGVAYMKFFAKDMIQELQQHKELKMEVVGKANLNEWGGTVTPQIYIENYEIMEDRLIDF